MSINPKSSAILAFYPELPDIRLDITLTSHDLPARTLSSLSCGAPK
jgi:hypothetical protein